MAESIRTLRRRLRRIEEDIAGCNDRIDWYERRLAELSKRRDEVLSDLGDEPPSPEPRQGPSSKSRGGGRTGSGGAGNGLAGNGLAGLAGIGGLGDLLANVDPATLSKAVGMIGPLLGGGGSGESSSDDGGSGDSTTEDVEEEESSGGVARASPGGDNNILQLISRVAKNVGAGGGGSQGGGGPHGDPMDGIAEVLEFVKAGHFKDRKLNMDDITSLVNLGRSPGVRSLVGTVSQLAAGVAAFNQLKKAMNKPEVKKPKPRQKPDLSPKPVPDSALTPERPAVQLEKAPSPPPAPELAIKLAPRNQAPLVAVPVRRRVT